MLHFRPVPSYAYRRYHVKLNAINVERITDPENCLRACARVKNSEYKVYLKGKDGVDFDLFRYANTRFLES